MKKEKEEENKITNNNLAAQYTKYIGIISLSRWKPKRNSFTPCSIISNLWSIQIQHIHCFQC